MNIKPIGKRILVKPLKMEEKTSSGIILPGQGDKEMPNMGEVLSLGSGEELKEVSPGDKVVYKRYSGTEIKDGEEKYIILEIEDVLAILEQ